jgi:hypothetical protein
MYVVLRDFATAGATAGLEPEGVVDMGNSEKSEPINQKEESR